MNEKKRRRSLRTLHCSGPFLAKMLLLGERDDGGLSIMEIVNEEKMYPRDKGRSFKRLLGPMEDK